jgi:hypothetical protein
MTLNIAWSLTTVTIATVFVFYRWLWKGELSFLQVYLGATAFALLFPIAQFHELGHGLGCMIHGDRWISTFWLAPHAHTVCSNDHTTITLIGGTAFSLFAWTICTTFFRFWLLPRVVGSQWFWFTCWIWFEWTFFCLSELVLWGFAGI